MKSVYNPWLKRILDVVIAFFLLMVLSWLMMAIALVYLLSFNFPVVYKQPRLGKDQKPFLLFKFRTLTNQTDLPLLQRQFAWGSFLRRWSLDELPQLWNVLKGEMSLIGPRPLLMEYAPLFSDEQNQRHEVRPGITGLAQVNGRTAISWKVKLQYDVDYVKQLSLALDIKILCRTVVLLFSFKEDVSLQEKKFTGKE